MYAYKEDIDDRLRNLCFLKMGSGMFLKRYSNGMSLWFFTTPAYSYDHYTLYTSRHVQVFSLMTTRP
jgi:hypothetical protein